MSTFGWQRHALVVHPDLQKLSQYQSVLSNNKVTSILARDLPTALLAIVQHHFDLALVCSDLAELGDGWTLAGVVHMAFPKAFVAVLTDAEDLGVLKAAINNGVHEVYEAADPPERTISAILTRTDVITTADALSDQPQRVQ
jgi:hypothetical protein